MRFIVQGDVNGDGRVSVDDWEQAYLASIGSVTLTGEAFLAADIDGDGNISSDDVNAIRKHINGETMLIGVMEIWIY